MNTADITQVLKGINGGKHRDSYLIYARRSTDEPESQKNSISYQKSENARYAMRERLRIANLTLPGFCTDGVISERHSAFKETDEMEFGEDGSVSYRVERPKFHQLASFLAKGYFKGVIFLCWDRASRNKGDGLIIGKLMKRGADFRFVLATYDHTSSGELHKDIDGMFSEHHSRITREKVKGTITKSRENGLCTHRAPVGYLNEGSMERKPLDPVRGPLVKALFEKADQTDWSLSDLQRWIIGQGFTMAPFRVRRTRQEILDDEERDGRRDMEKRCLLPSVANIHKILTNPFYTGMTRGNAGDWVKSTSHQPLISEALFDRVQQRLQKRRTSTRYDKKLPLPFRGFLRCVCGRVYTPYEQKGIVYYGARCDRTCANSRKSRNLGYVFEVARKAIDDLVFTDDELARIDEAAGATTGRLEKKLAREHDAKERGIRKLHEDLRYLAENRLTLLRAGAYTPEALAADEARLRDQLAVASAQPAFSAPEIHDALAGATNLSELLKMAQVSYEKADKDKKETYVRLVGSELSLSENTVYLQCRRGFEVLNRPFFTVSDLTAWLSELIEHQSDIKEAIEDLQGWLAGVSESSVEEWRHG